MKLLVCITVALSVSFAHAQDALACANAVVQNAQGGVCGGITINPVTDLTSVPAWQANGFAQCRSNSVFFQFIDCSSNAILACLNCRNFSIPEFASGIATQASLGCFAVESLNACVGSPFEAEAAQKCANLDATLQDILNGNPPCSGATTTVINLAFVVFSLVFSSYMIHT